MSCKSVDSGPLGCRRINHPTVRTRKFTKNGTITRPSSTPRHRGGTRVASQYANGNPISSVRTVPSSEICSVCEKTCRNSGESASLYRSNESLSVAIVLKMFGL